ncbi:MAG: amidohydrolase [SAR86 cluster bacterium]|jgi:imidazolonepropionase-like amidohydrolase|nr:amidohydrolase [SAR86 cluster bacterium]|tara:strand:- start:18895 stop:20247 length:1353 start_codon:yes stop_codon:yes gene_type:complete
MKKYFLLIIFFALLSCSEDHDSRQGDFEVFKSTYVPEKNVDFIIKGARILTGTGKEILDGFIWVSENKIKDIGETNDMPEGIRVISGEGKWVTPGIIDIHSHMGVYPSPSLKGNSDGNEATNPVTSHVWAEHSVWTQDPQMPLALKGGITTFHVLPGSANLFGGRGVTLKNVWSTTVQGMKFPGAPYTLKMACGENPKRVYGRRKGTEPSTRMGNVAGYRNAWIDAVNYSDKTNLKRDLKLDTLAGVLNGEILVQNHCYRAEEMAIMLDISKEFGYKVTAFHHAIEAYKVANLLSENDVCAAMWADWWGFKNEAFDMVWENVAIVDQANEGKGCAIVHSDSAIGIQRLNQEAAKAMAAGRRAGLDIPRSRAIQWITRNPAKALGILDRVGTIEKGKMADLVLWDSDPFSVYSKTERVFIDGIQRYFISDSLTPKSTDFELGIIQPDKNRL